MTISEENTIHEVIAEDYRTAAIFETFGIDYYSKSDQTLLELCLSRGIEPRVLVEDLNQAILSTELAVE